MKTLFHSFVLACFLFALSGCELSSKPKEIEFGDATITPSENSRLKVKDEVLKVSGHSGNSKFGFGFPTSSSKSSVEMEKGPNTMNGTINSSTTGFINGQEERLSVSDHWVSENEMAWWFQFPDLSYSTATICGFDGNGAMIYQDEDYPITSSDEFTFKSKPNNGRIIVEETYWLWGLYCHKVITRDIAISGSNQTFSAISIMPNVDSSSTIQGLSHKDYSFENLGEVMVPQISQE